MVESDDRSHFKKCDGFCSSTYKRISNFFSTVGQVLLHFADGYIFSREENKPRTTSFLILDNSTEVISSYLIEISSYMYPLPHF